MAEVGQSKLPTEFYQAQPDVVQQARKEYPYLEKANVGFLYTPNVEEKRKMEYWPIGETGTADAPRPLAFPLESPGIQIFSLQAKPLDLLGEYVSHGAVKSDPALTELYEQFSKLVPEETLQERYKWHRENAGERRPYESWKEQTGLPELFRGYTFNQFGEHATEIYTPEQLKVLDQVREYLGITGH